MKKENTLIPMGKALCASLNQVLTQIRNPKFRESTDPDMTGEIADSIETAMVAIASLCCCSDSWQDLCDFLLSAGAELSEDFLNAPDR